MTLFDDDFSKPPDRTPEISSVPEQEPASPVASNELVLGSQSELQAGPQNSDPLWPVLHVPVPYSQRPEVPEDLRISWSWPHVLCFIAFAFISLLVVQTGFAIYYSPKHALPQNELEQYFLSNPLFIVGSNVAWFSTVLLFLYVSLSVLPGVPFWRTLGWRKFSSTVAAIHSKLPTKPWIYFLFGCGLSLITAIAGSRVHTPDNMPIEQLLKSRSGSILMMSMAVLVAPLVEETVFRGYLYPALVRMFSGYFSFVAEDYGRATKFSFAESALIVGGLWRLLHKGRVVFLYGLAFLLVSLLLNYMIVRYVGKDVGKGLRTGIGTSILLTGLLFGMLHGAQLAWTWGIVTLLIVVGITFTYVRAKTGTVFASYLMHLGYNSLIAFATVVGTHGFTKMPPHP